MGEVVMWLTGKVNERDQEDDVACHRGDTEFKQLCAESESEDHDKSWHEDAQALDETAKSKLVPTWCP